MKPVVADSYFSQPAEIASITNPSLVAISAHDSLFAVLAPEPLVKAIFAHDSFAAASSLDACKLPYS